MPLTPDELEKDLTDLGREIRHVRPPADLIPGTLSALDTRPARPRPRQGLSPVWLTGLLLLASLPLFSFGPEPPLNVAKILLALFSFGAASLFLLEPEVMVTVDHRMLGSILSRIGPAATPDQERLLFRLQGIYFIGIAFFIGRI